MGFLNDLSCILATFQKKIQPNSGYSEHLPNGWVAHVILVTGFGISLVNIGKIRIEYLPMHVAAKVNLNSEYCYCEL